MKILIVDDEPLVLKGMEMTVAEELPAAEIFAFSKAREAMNCASEHMMDIAFLDINMRQMSGIAMAKELLELNARTNIIFCTGYSEYMPDAFDLRASDYLMKPVTAEKLHHAIDSLRFPPELPSTRPNTIFARCYGEFEVFYNDEKLPGMTKRARELLAYLVYRRGELCPGREIMDVVFSGLAESYFRVARVDLEASLDAVGQAGVLIHPWGKLGVDVDRIVCDWYEYEKGNPWAISQYKDTFMSQYTWAQKSAQT